MPEESFIEYLFLSAVLFFLLDFGEILAQPSFAGDNEREVYKQTSTGKRSTGRKRGIQRGVAKHKIRSRPVAGKLEGERRLLGFAESVYFATSKRCFEFWFLWCDKLYLAPFTRSTAGVYVPSDWKRKLIHYVVWFIIFLSLLHKLWVLGRMLLYEELKVETFMCMSQFLVYFVPVCISLGVILRPKETMDLLNSWPLLFQSLKEVRDDIPSPFDNLSAALEIISTLVSTQVIALTMALFSLAFSTLPTCYFPAMENLGLIPAGLLPRFCWQLIFFPLEYATYLPPMLIASLAGGIVLIETGVYKIYTAELRSVLVLEL